jgi:hypothetical protein
MSTTNTAPQGLSATESQVLAVMRDLPPTFTGYLNLKFTDGKLTHIRQEVTVRGGQR